MTQETTETLDRVLSELTDEISQLRAIRYQARRHGGYVNISTMIEELDERMMNTYRYGQNVLEGVN